MNKHNNDLKDVSLYSGIHALSTFKCLLSQQLVGRLQPFHLFPTFLKNILILAALYGRRDLSMRDLLIVPRPGIEPMPPALGAQSLNHWTTREVPISQFLKSVNQGVWIKLFLI